MLDYDRFREKYGEKAKHEKEGANSEQRLAAFLQAGVSAERLTHNDDWDKYLAYLESALARTKLARDDILERMAGPEVVVAEEFYRTKHELTKFSGMIAALEWAMELPKSIIESGDAARELLPEARAEVA